MLDILSVGHAAYDITMQVAQHPSVDDKLQAAAMDLAGNVDVLAASAAFARQWCGTEDMDNALDQLAGVNDCTVITLGAKGLIWQRHGERGALPAFRVQAVDSTGAGDAFHGALAHALATDMAWQEALRFASAAAALSCTRLGARRALPGSAAVHALLETA